jgi:hypothetical protein
MEEYRDSAGAEYMFWEGEDILEMIPNKFDELNIDEFFF